MRTTLNVRGFAVSTATTRKAQACRYAAVAVRPERVTTDKGTYVAFARLERQSDNLNTLRTYARTTGSGPGALIVVIDKLTGEEI